MSVKIERTNQIKFQAKGVFEEIGIDSLTFRDVKEGVSEKLTFAQLKELLGKEVTFTLASKELAE